MVKIKVKLHPSSSKEEVRKIDDNYFEVWIKEKPIEGKANLYLEKFLKKYFGKKSEIVSGFNSRIKFVYVED